jgi:hypothetical protein
MLTAIIGLFGVLVGIFLTEYFRRQRRIEFYSKEVFQKRLSVYEELYKKMEASYLIATDVIENPDYSEKERGKIISEVIMDVASFTDQNGLYLNENLVIHCLLTLIGVEDIFSIENPDEKETQITTFREAYGKAKQLIRKESGMETLDKLFGSISKAKLESPYISYYQKIKRERRR